MPWIWYLLWSVAILTGLAAESTTRPALDPRATALDLVTGWAICACGLLSWRARPTSYTGTLLVACGFAWFAGNFASPSNWVAFQWPPLEAIAAPVTHLYRGLLVHAIVTYPTGRVTSPIARVTVVAGYVTALLPAVWQVEAATIVLATAFAIATWLVHRHAARRGDLPAQIALGVSFALAASVIVASIARVSQPFETFTDLTVFAFEIVLMAVAAAMFLGLSAWPARRDEVTDLVVELGESQSGTLRDALAAVLGDPSLEVGYWMADRREYVDTGGHPIDPAVRDATRAITAIDHDGVPVAVLLHQPALLDDRRLVGAIGDAARLAASNADLQAQVKAQVLELEASRRRLVDVADEERRELEHRLQEGAIRRLHMVEGQLRSWQASHNSPSDGPSDADTWVAAAFVDLSATLSELRELANGLRPALLSEHGLPAALAELVARSAVPVTFSVVPERWSPGVEATAYYVCAEALTNVAKHARATAASIRVTRDGRWLRVEVDDDGVGGASKHGMGIQGLRDRVLARGGRLTVDSQPGHGTRLAAEIPVGDEAS